MNVKQAKMLEILSRTSSVSEAAAEMGTSQPRLTQQLKAVEAELGVDLFLRSPRGLVLSDAGKTFLPFANQLTSTYQRAQEALSTLSEGESEAPQVRCQHHCLSPARAGESSSFSQAPSGGPRDGDAHRSKGIDEGA